MYCLTRELLGKDCAYLVMKNVALFNSPFIKGRAHQLVMDKSKAVPNKKGRKQKMLCYIRQKTEDEILAEAIKLTLPKRFPIPTSKKGIKKLKRLEFNQKKTSNGWDNLFCISDNTLSFEQGRAFQFLLDTDHKKYNISNIFDLDDFQEEAHDRLIHILEPKEGDWVNHRCCDGCDIWVFGERRCSCGNRRIMWESYGWGTFDLDYTEPYGYCEAY